MTSTRRIFSEDGAKDTGTCAGGDYGMEYGGDYDYNENYDESYDNNNYYVGQWYSGQQGYNYQDYGNH